MVFLCSSRICCSNAINMKKFIKRMRNNNSYFPSDHIHPLQILENMNHPMIPKLISYDNYAYTCEHS